MTGQTGPAALDEWAERYARASRGNLAGHSELISFRRRSVSFFSGLNLKRKYELDRDDAIEWLQKCPTVYFTDYTGSYDDTAELIADGNPIQRLSPFLLDVAKGSGLTMAMFELDFVHMDPAVKTELAACVHPDTHVPLDMFTIGALKALGMEAPDRDFFGYRRFLETCGRIRSVLLEKGVFAGDMNSVTDFLFYVFAESGRS